MARNRVRYEWQVVWRYGFGSLNRDWEGFHKQSIFEPGQPQRVNACGFFIACRKS